METNDFYGLGSYEEFLSDDPDCPAFAGVALKNAIGEIESGRKYEVIEVNFIKMELGCYVEGDTGTPSIRQKFTFAVV